VLPAHVGRDGILRAIGNRAGSNLFIRFWRAASPPQATSPPHNFCRILKFEKTMRHFAKSVRHGCALRSCSCVVPKELPAPAGYSAVCTVVGVAPVAEAVGAASATNKIKAVLCVKARLETEQARLNLYGSERFSSAV
jgi:hypothetical protein